MGDKPGLEFWNYGGPGLPSGDALIGLPDEATRVIEVRPILGVVGCWFRDADGHSWGTIAGGPPKECAWCRALFRSGYAAGVSLGGVVVCTWHIVVRWDDPIDERGEHYVGAGDPIHARPKRRRRKATAQSAEAPCSPHGTASWGEWRDALAGRYGGSSLGGLVYLEQLMMRSRDERRCFECGEPGAVQAASGMIPHLTYWLCNACHAYQAAREPAPKRRRAGAAR